MIMKLVYVLVLDFFYLENIVYFAVVIVIVILEMAMILNVWASVE